MAMAGEYPEIWANIPIFMERKYFDSLQHRTSVADDKGTCGGPKNDDGLERLHQHVEPSSHSDEAAEDAG